MKLEKTEIRRYQGLGNESAGIRCPPIIGQ